jgi:hypothetical protein
MKDLIFRNRMLLRILSVLIVLIGIILSYIYYGTEPMETVGGFMSGLGLGLFLIFISLKPTENN